MAHIKKIFKLLNYNCKMLKAYPQILCVCWGRVVGHGFIYLGDTWFILKIKQEYEKAGFLKKEKQSQVPFFFTVLVVCMAPTNERMSLSSPKQTVFKLWKDLLFSQDVVGLILPWQG